MTKKTYTYISHRESFGAELMRIIDDKNRNFTRNQINIASNDPDLKYGIDTPIYRILPYSRLRSCFNKNTLGLVRIKKWDDPFENWLLKSKFILKNRNSASIASRDDFFGQCWSYADESDAMWRIYSSLERRGVKVKTTIRKLLDILIKNVEERNEEDNKPLEISKFIGKVKYLDKEKIEGELKKNVKEFATTNLGQAQSFFFKRLEFQHEKEIRILFKTSEVTYNRDVFELKICANDLFDEIILDPRLEQEEVEEMIKNIKGWGYEKNVEQSSLYNFEDINFNLDL